MLAVPAGSGFNPSIRIDENYDRTMCSGTLDKTNGLVKIGGSLTFPIFDEQWRKSSVEHLTYESEVLELPEEFFDRRMQLAAYFVRPRHCDVDKSCVGQRFSEHVIPFHVIAGIAKPLLSHGVTVV